VLKIIPVSNESIPLIRDLTYRVWPQTYRGILSDDQIEYMLDMMYSEDSLKRQMAEGAEFIIVYDNDNPIGFASYQRMTPDKYKLHKIYVLPDQQGKGTGRSIIDYVMNDIKKKGGRSLHLQVNKNNTAKEFYERLGFKEVEQVKLDIGKGYFMDDYIMEKTFN
jgi:diamine N-acetyltransferase